MSHDALVQNPLFRFRSMTDRAGPKRLSIARMTCASTEYIALANSFLSAFKPVAALEEYTKVLTNVAPGHPCAFLNRSLCYLLLDYPALAVVDAHRALYAAFWANTGEVGNDLSRYIVIFGRETEETLQCLGSWNRVPTCWPGYELNPALLHPKLRKQPGSGRVFSKHENLTGRDHEQSWLFVDLASLAIRRRETNSKSRPVLEGWIHDIVLKAYYRLALALWMCGGGALRSALDVLCEAREQPFCNGEDENHFLAMGNCILEEMESMYATQPNASVLFDSRYTRIRRAAYPWDTYSLSGSAAALAIFPQPPTSATSEATARLLHGLQGRLSPACSAKLREEQGKLPQIELKAAHSLPAAATLIEEFSSFHVVCGSASDSMIPCETCGARLDVSEELAVRANDVAYFAAKEETSQILVASRKSSFREASPDLGEILPNPDYHRLRRSARRFTPSEIATSPRKTLTPAGFQLCPSCRTAAFCGIECHRRACEAFHFELCETGLEDYASNSILNISGAGVPQPHERELLRRMMQRVLANVAMHNEHPLETLWIKALHGGSDPAQPSPDDHNPLLHPKKPRAPGASSDHLKAKGATMVWSYEDNVRHPIHALLTIGGSSLALDVARLDGWVLNTLTAKVEHAMRITPYTRFEKFFDNDGSMIGQRLSAAESLPPSPESGNDFNMSGDIVWTASLHPIASLVKVADAGETPNVELYERQGTVFCKTVPPARTVGFDDIEMLESPSEETKPVLVPGDQLLRSATIFPLGDASDIAQGLHLPTLRRTPPESHSQTSREADTMADADITVWSATDEETDNEDEYVDGVGYGEQGDDDVKIE